MWKNHLQNIVLVYNRIRYSLTMKGRSGCLEAGGERVARVEPGLNSISLTGTPSRDWFKRGLKEEVNGREKERKRGKQTDEPAK